MFSQSALTTAADYDFLRKLVYEQSQNVLDPSRDYLFETRLARLMRNENLCSLDQLVARMRSMRDASLESAVAEAMTINETSFFRDSRPFELLKTMILPELIERRRLQRTLRFWSAACSSGQEAYSIAMLLRESFPELSGWKIRIEGTDLASEMVQKAQQGRYHRIEINRGLPARNVVRYFDHTGEDWFVKPELRELCNFRVANLCQALPFHEPFDMIFLRNVMLYFSDDTRRSLLRGVHRMLSPDGYLFLGSSEQPVELGLWNTVLVGGTCHYRPRRSS
jgi:chemotaxis protein methyltransferase CheR